MSSLADLGISIQQLRKAKGWSQAELARLAGLDRTTIGALERDTYTDIGIRKVQRVLQLLGKTLITKDIGMPTLDDLNQTKGDW
ncbi:helix-turn-helix transcriptional regulator [Parendozoicomonas sp. Alg238-R29]|uniref:helix-turn-helix transcriptional regulator n=1 Tax=Parendozoicomonas sp. Alg238-R29 TaxID=2993446 RepID=UPI00248D6D43|nr:helix-turn-helix transcriptional regulator [Parendozoicomonas sp. Alg238-R29]